MELLNKRIMYFGDSIMSQDGKPYGYNADFNKDQLGIMCEGYPTLINQHFGLKCVGNFSSGGHRISQQSKIILTKDFSETDIVVIGVGVNDFSGGTCIGKIPDSTETVHDHTFIGDYCTALDHIFTSNPHVKVILMTPLHRNTLHRQGNVPVNTIDTRINGYTLRDYAEAILRIGEFYSCPVADMYANGGLNRFNLKLYTFEGVHPTNDGYRFVIPVVLDAFRKIG